MLRICCDLDGVLANFTDAYAARLTFRTTIPFPPASDEWPKVWYWDRAMGITRDEETTTWEEDIIKSINFWKRLDPLPNARPAVRWLNRLTHSCNEVYFITNRIGKKAKLQTEQWLYDLGMSYPTVIVTADKLPFLRALKANFFIDDKTETIQEIAAANLPDLKLYLREWFYNSNQPCPTHTPDCQTCGGTNWVPMVYPANVLKCKGLLEALQESYGQ